MDVPGKNSHLGRGAANPPRQLRACATVLFHRPASLPRPCFARPPISRFFVSWQPGSSFSPAAFRGLAFTEGGRRQVVWPGTARGKAPRAKVVTTQKKTHVRLTRPAAASPETLRRDWLRHRIFDQPAPDERQATFQLPFDRIGPPLSQRPLLREEPRATVQSPGPPGPKRASRWTGSHARFFASLAPATEQHGIVPVPQENWKAFVPTPLIEARRLSCLLHERSGETAPRIILHYV